jgi:hypothetical protein
MEGRWGGAVVLAVTPAACLLAGSPLAGAEPTYHRRFEEGLPLR